MMQAAKNNDLNQFETLNQLAKDYLSTLIENRKKKKINVWLMHKKKHCLHLSLRIFCRPTDASNQVVKTYFVIKPHFSTAHHSYLSSNVSKYFRPNAYVFVF